MARHQFTIPGRPFAKQRHRIGLVAGRARAFTPAETVSFERQVGQIAAQAIPAPIQGPVGLTIIATFAMAASWSKKKRAALAGRPHTQRPDLDNLAKAVSDGLNRIAFADDAQVASASLTKIWGDRDQTVVIVEAL